MRVILEDRVEHAIRYLQPADAKKIARVLHTLEQENFVKIRAQFLIVKLPLNAGEQLFVLRATNRLRILFRYEPEETLVIEDIVSHDALNKHFTPARP